MSMENALLRIQDGEIIIDQAQLTTYAIAAAALIVLIAIIAVVAKTRKKDFIKTVPTNLKKGR